MTTSIFRTARLVAKKDLTIELRTREVLLTTGLFALLVVVLASLSFYVDPSLGRKMAPGVLWIAIAFSGVLAMSRTWAREREHDVMRGLLQAPVPRAGIYLGKLFGTFVFLLAIEVLIVPLVALFFHVALTPVLAPLSALLVLGTFGFAAAGTLFSAMTVQTRARDLVLSVVLFPLIAPTLLAAVVATRELFGGAPEVETWMWIKILSANDLMFLASGLVLFGPLTTD